MKILPVRPDLRRRARRLQRAFRGADPASLAAVRHYDSAFGTATDEAVAGSSFSVLDAQRVVARQHGFRGWPALASYVDRARGGASSKDRENGIGRTPALTANRQSVAAAAREGQHADAAPPPFPGDPP